MPKTRAAVVIGVDQPRGLPRLSGAASGARTFGNWLESEGFDVKLFVDDQGPVEIKPITDAMKELVNRPTLEQLVVYFSGHGCVLLDSERWLLSDAPEDSNAAITFLPCFARAQQFPIPNIVFISDACRSKPDTFGMAQISGSSLFPAPELISTPFQPHIDTFFATMPGHTASEVSVEQSVSEYEGIYTSAFLDAFKRPTQQMILDLGGGLKVVPNRKLEEFLFTEVRKRARARSIQRPQFPQTNVTALDEMYIGRVAADAQIQESGAPEPNVSDVVRAALVAVDPRLTTARADFSQDSIDAIAEESGFTHARDAILLATFRQTPGSLLTSGIRIIGAQVERVAAAPGVRTELVVVEGQTIVHVEYEGPAATVAIQFSDGNGTVAAGLRYFVANIVVDGGLVSSVSYDSEGNPPNDQIRRLQATVAAAARLGIFRIQGSGEERMRQAVELGNSLRMGKFADPTLGIYAAYAYNEAAFSDRVHSVAQLMRDDLGAQLFDVAMLAGELTGRGPDLPADIFPQCPMLSQGWNFLQAADVHLPVIYQSAQHYLLPALWTTFARPGMDLIVSALQEGRLR
ncbi:caspase family protein [Mesorhizobium sp. IMUNJ 23033]|uniref:caspase family protein n=1 Tax=Mesorhizobium sp. IMUNJ 23033 TaxID=3378039 RepID=UPI00384F91A4